MRCRHRGWDGGDNQNLPPDLQAGRDVSRAFQIKQDNREDSVFSGRHDCPHQDAAADSPVSLTTVARRPANSAQALATILNLPISENRQSSVFVVIWMSVVTSG